MRRTAQAAALAAGIAAGILPGLWAAAPAQEVDTGVRTVAEARRAVGGTLVRLEGRVTARTGEGRYLLGDATGEIELRIRPFMIGNRPLPELSRVRVTGEVRQRPLRPHIDAGIVERLD